MASYTQRLHAFVPSRTYTVTDDALLWRDGKGGSGRLAYADLAEVRLSYAPTRVQKNRYFMTLSTGHDKPLQISNEDYRGLADFQDRSLSYRVFVDELYRAIAAANSSVCYRSGSSKARHMLHWAITLFLILVLATAAMVLLATGLYWLIVVKLAVIAYFLPLLRRYLRLNTPNAYDPLALPESMLPPAPKVAEA